MLNSSFVTKYYYQTLIIFYPLSPGCRASPRRATTLYGSY